MKPPQPLQRRSPLRRRSKRVPPLGRSNRKGDDAKLSRARKAVRERSGGMCEIRVPDTCTGWGQHVHHRLMRSQGGTHDVGNLLDCCLACHEHVHANPAESYERGWLLHRLATEHPAEAYRRGVSVHRNQEGAA